MSKTSALYTEIKDGVELKHVMDIIKKQDHETCGDLFYDLQTLHTRVKELEVDEIHRLCEYVHASLF